MALLAVGSLVGSLTSKRTQVEAALYWHSITSNAFYWLKWVAQAAQIHREKKKFPGAQTLECMACYEIVKWQSITVSPLTPSDSSHSPNPQLMPNTSLHPQESPESYSILHKISIWSPGYCHLNQFQILMRLLECSYWSEAVWNKETRF